MAWKNLPAPARIMQPGDYPLLSFLVINWNYGQYIDKAIRSIKAQLYPNFKCLIVDNNSDDDSINIAKEAIRIDRRFEIEKLEKNYGQLGAAVRSIDRLEGEYISIVDSDDYIFRNYASFHVQIHEALKESIGISCGNMIEIDSEGAVLSGHAIPFDSGIRASSSRRAELTGERFPIIDGPAYERLKEHTAEIPSSAGGWLWAPGKSSEYLLPNYASLHIQVHLGLSQTVAMTSGEMVKLATDGSLIATATTDHLFDEKKDKCVTGLRASALLPRLSTVSDELFAMLSDSAVTYPHNVRTDVWQSGAASMYRRFVLEIVRPLASPSPDVQSAADMYFGRLCHLFGGSARFYVPVAATRTRSEDYQLDPQDARRHRLKVRRPPFPVRVEMARAVLDRVDEFNWRTGRHLWSILDVILNWRSGQEGDDDYGRREIFTLLAEHMVNLIVEAASRHFSNNRCENVAWLSGIPSLVEAAARFAEEVRLPIPFQMIDFAEDWNGGPTSAPLIVRRSMTRGVSAGMRLYARHNI
jgi:Glycosyl transferase family 2